MQDLTELLSKLKAVSDENRFRLLEDLKKPRTINDIHLTAETDAESYRGDRRLTRQGIQYHLDILREAELVTANLEKREGRMMNVHRVDPCGLFVFWEQLGDLVSRLGSDQAGTEHPTRDLEEQTRKWPQEPRLVLTHGLMNGRAFGLSGKPSSAHRGWIIGRSPKAEITLPYDPYISAEDTEIIPSEDGYKVLDLRTSTNRTQINDRTLDFGGQARLDRGDLIQIGRSQLLYQGP